MSRAYNVIDVDGHILEPFDLWHKYTDPKYRDRAPRLVEDENGKRRLIIEERAAGDPQRGFGSIGGIGARQGAVKASPQAAVVAEVINLARAGRAGGRWTSRSISELSRSAATVAAALLPHCRSL